MKCPDGKDGCLVNHTANSWVPESIDYPRFTFEPLLEELIIELKKLNNLLVNKEIRETK